MDLRVHHSRRSRRRRQYSTDHRHSLAESSDYGTGWMCDGCHRRAERGDTRFRCTHSCDFDLCTACMSRSQVPHELHSIMFADRRPEDDLEVQPYRPRFPFVDDLVAFELANAERRRVNTATEGGGVQGNGVGARTMSKATLFGKEFVLPFDRLQLTSMMDRMHYFHENVVCVILVFLTAYMGLLLSHKFSDVALIALWGSVASSQYALLKSVQPDSGCLILDTRTAAYTRALMLCAFGGLILLFDYGASHSLPTSPTTPEFYGIPYPSPAVLSVFSEILQTCVLCSPAIFLFGILPQWKTLVHYILEQIDLHVYGGAGTPSLAAATVVSVENILLSSITFAVGLAAFDACGGTCTSEFSYAVFCGLIVSFAFLTARVDSELVVDIIRNWSFQGISTTYITWMVVRFIVLWASYTCLTLTTFFVALQPALSTVLYAAASGSSFILYYLIGTLRSAHPWRILARPVLSPSEAALECSPKQSFFAHLDWFEKVGLFLKNIEQYIIYPMLVLSAVARDSSLLISYFGVVGAAAITAVCGIKLCRLGFLNRQLFAQSLVLALLFFNYDYPGASMSVLLDVSIVSVLVYKIREAYQKFISVLTYNVPWNAPNTLSSGFHLIMYPLVIPHLAMVIAQCIITGFFSMPLYPLLAGPLFLPSYLRPIRFWEKEYRTQHRETAQDASPDALPAQNAASTVGVSDEQSVSGAHRESDRTGTEVMARSGTIPQDITTASTNLASNLNNLFYIQILSKVKENLARDLLIGRWGTYELGDVYIISDPENRLTAFVHIVELGCDFVRFQMRGLELAGTFCQSREQEALAQNFADVNGGDYFVSFRTYSRSAWYSWTPISYKYPLLGYSISLLPGISLFQGFEFRKAFHKHLIFALIYFVSKNKNLRSWLQHPRVYSWLQRLGPNYVDRDMCFSSSLDIDYCSIRKGVHLSEFHSKFSQWIEICLSRRVDDPSSDANTAVEQRRSKETDKEDQQCNLRKEDSPPREGVMHISDDHDDIASLKPGDNVAETVFGNPKENDEDIVAEDVRASPLAQSMAILASRKTVCGGDAAPAPCAVNSPVDLDNRDSDITAADWPVAETGRSASIIPASHAIGSTADCMASTCTPCAAPAIPFITPEVDSLFTRLCFALSLCIRRTILFAARDRHGDSDAFLHGFLQAFNGLVEPRSLKDEWIDSCPELKKILVHVARMSLQLQKDYTSYSEFAEPLSDLFDLIEDYADPNTGVVVLPETDPAWRQAILSDRPSLLSFRFNLDDSSNNKEFFVVVLTSGTRMFRVHKVNKELVRGFWAAQQQEVLFLRNTFNERGSIQSATFILRNMINQSCDQPVGYPVFVSDLTVSTLPDWDISQIFRGAVRASHNTILSLANRLLAWWSSSSGDSPQSRGGTRHGAEPGLALQGATRRERGERAHADAADGRDGFGTSQLLVERDTLPSSSSDIELALLQPTPTQTTFLSDVADGHDHPEEGNHVPMPTSWDRQKVLTGDWREGMTDEPSNLGVAAGSGSTGTQDVTMTPLWESLAEVHAQMQAMRGDASLEVVKQKGDEVSSSSARGRAMRVGGNSEEDDV